MSKKLSVTFAPHIQEPTSITSMSYNTIAALSPAVLLGFYFFGIRAVILVALSVLTAVATEAGIQKIMNRPISASDGTAALTGLLLAMLIPVGCPWWAVIIGSAVAIFLGRYVFGGLGANPFNPVLVGLVVLQLSWPDSVNQFFETSSLFSGFAPLTNVDASELGLGLLQYGDAGGVMDMYSWGDVLIGNIPGGIGSTSVLALLAGGLFLVWKRITPWQIPAGFLGGMFVFGLIFWLTDGSGETYANPFYHLVFGYSLIGAFFLAPDSSTSPYTEMGMLAYGVLAGVLTMIIRYWGAYQEGVVFALLFLNALTPILDRIRVKSYGKVKTA